MSDRTESETRAAIDRMARRIRTQVQKGGGRDDAQAAHAEAREIAKRVSRKKEP